MNKVDDIDKNCLKDHYKLYQSARQMMKSRNYANAISILEPCLKLKDCQMDKTLKLDMYLTLAFPQYYLAKYNDSFNNFLQALDICNGYISEYNTEKNNFLKVNIKALMYLSTISFFLNNYGQAKIYYFKMEDRINNEENVENKISSIRELLKILFNYGVLKLNRKKSTLEEIDNLRKEIGFIPMMMIHSKLGILLNHIIKDDTLVIAWIKFLNEKWLMNEYGSEKLVKIAEHMNELLLSSKPFEVIKKSFSNELIKNSIKLDNPESLLNDLKDRLEIIKVFVKRLSFIISLNPTSTKIKTKDKLPKIPSTNKNLPSVTKNINLFLNSSISNDHDKENKSSPKLSENKLFNTNPHRINISAKDIHNLNPFLYNHTPLRNTNLINEHHGDKKMEIKSPQVPSLTLEKNQPFKRNLSVNNKVSNTKVLINDTTIRNSLDSNSNSNLGNDKNNQNNNMLKPRHSDGNITNMNDIKKKEEKLKIININFKSNGSIKDTLIHEKIDYKPIFEEFKEQYSSNNYNKDLLNLKLHNYIAKYAYKSKPGKKSNNEEKVNQDSYLVIENYMKIRNFYLFGVCDGHGIVTLIKGLNGHLCSNHVKYYLPANLQLIELNKIILNEKKFQEEKGKKRILKEEIKQINLNKSNYKQFYDKYYDKFSFSQNIEASRNIATNITEAFLKTQEDIIERDFEVNYSGSTVCTVFILGNVIYCANVGDSRCIIGRYENDKKLQPFPISQDHKPSEPEEKERIIQNGGRVEAFKNEDNEDVGPLRVWLQDEDVPGLAMSRSIGDMVAARVGVIHSPEISMYKISKNDKFLIIASDGLWEFVSNEYAVQIVSRFWLSGDADGAVDELIRISSHFWEEKESVRDDITIIVIFIDSSIKK